MKCPECGGADVTYRGIVDAGGDYGDDLCDEFHCNDCDFCFEDNCHEYHDAADFTQLSFYDDTEEIRTDEPTEPIEPPRVDSVGYYDGIPF